MDSTRKFDGYAKHLLERGSQVYCAEPNDDMRQTAEKELGCYENFHSVAGNAQDTNGISLMTITIKYCRGKG